MLRDKHVVKIYNFTPNCSPDVYLTTTSPPYPGELRYFVWTSKFEWLKSIVCPIRPSHEEIRYLCGLQIWIAYPRLPPVSWRTLWKLLLYTVSFVLRADKI